MHGDRPHQQTAATLTYVAAAIALGSTVLEWYSITRERGTSEGVIGLETSVGMGTIGIAVALLIAGALLLARGRVSGGLASSVVVVVLSLMMLFAAARTLGATGPSYANFEAGDVAEQRGISDAEAEGTLLAAIERGDLEVDPGLGPLVALIPGLLGILAGGLGCVQSGRIKEARAGTAAS